MRYRCMGKPNTGAPFVALSDGFFVSYTATAKDERSGLANALVLIERREAQLKGRR